MDDGSAARAPVKGSSEVSTARLREQFGDIDIYLFDQLLRGRITHGMRILDAGCGEGRNLVYLIREQFDVSGIDQRPQSIDAIRRRAGDLGYADGDERFSVQSVEKMSFANGSFDVVISSAVLHFARDEGHWWAMVEEMWRVLAPGGMLFARLASTIGHESRVRPLGDRRFILPDGSERFLVDEAYLVAATGRLGGELLDPIKTTVVQAARSMTTWVLRRRPGG
jgi:tellurite methyltransferase